MLRTLTTINNIYFRRFRRGGHLLVALVVAFGVLSCASSSKDSSADGRNSDGMGSKPEPVAVEVSPRPSMLQYHSGLQALENRDWLEAQYYLDLALNELVSEMEDSVYASDTVGFQTMTVKILTALENVYPHLADQAIQDSGNALLQELAPGDELPQESDIPLDSGEVMALENALDSLDLSKFSLPVVINERVLRELKFFSQGAKEFARGSLSRKTLFEEMIRAKLRERNMPEDLLFLAFVESGFKTKAYSRAKASGLWQFIPGTGKRYGLHVDFWVDERRNPVMATDAALDYLQDLYREFGDWLLAMAAYNCGEGRVRRLLRETDSTDYWSLKLPRETMHYVPRILAAAIIGHSPKRFGFEPEQQEQIPFDTVTVNECIPLQNVADAAGASLSTIRDLNLELNRWTTPPNQRSYTLRIPVGSRDRFLESYTHMDKAKFSRWSQHRVRAGENLGVIAREYGLSVAELRDVNGLKNNRIRAGQTLLIPLPYGAMPPSGSDSGEPSVRGKSTMRGTYTVRSGDNLSTIARRFGVASTDLQKWNTLDGNKLKVGQTLRVAAPSTEEKSAAPTASVNKVKASGAIYTVKPGDNYYSISQNLGVSMNDLMELNEAHGSRLATGQTLRLPAGAKLQAKETVDSNPKATLQLASRADIHVVKDGENLYAISRRYQVGISDLLRWNNLDEKSKVKVGQKVRVRPGVPETPNPGNFYTVRKGDTLWDIARRYGISVQQIMDWNSLTDGKVKPGARIKVGL